LRKKEVQFENEKARWLKEQAKAKNSAPDKGFKKQTTLLDEQNALEYMKNEYLEEKTNLEEKGKKLHRKSTQLAKKNKNIKSRENALHDKEKQILKMKGDVEKNLQDFLIEKKNLEEMK